MPHFSRIKMFWQSLANSFFFAGAFFVVVFAAWGSGITIPSNSTLNVNNGLLIVDGSIYNSGILTTTTGRIELNGNWTMNGQGVYLAGTGTVDFTASAGVQYLTPGADISDAFYDLTHSGAGTVVLQQRAVDINGTFSNLSGAFMANSFNMTVAGNWNNTSALTFISGSSTVYLDGTDQSIYGSTTFYGFSKTLDSPGSRTLTFPAGEEQIVQNSLTLKGYNDTDNLILRSSVTHSPALLTLQSSGAQNIRTVDVQDNNANNGITLVARGGSSLNSGNNLNWQFGAVTITWDGSEDEDWNNPFNWNLGLVPGIGDNAVIPAVATLPMLTSSVPAHVNNLTIALGASVTLNQQDLTLDGALTNHGNLILNGMETVTAGTMVNDGTFTYYGMQNGFVNVNIARNFSIGGSYVTTFHDLVIHEQNMTTQTDSFTTDAIMTITNDMTLTAGTFSIISGVTVYVQHDLTVAGGTLTVSGDVSVTNNTTVSGGQVNLDNVSAQLTDLQGLFVSSGTLNALQGNLRLNDVTVSGGVLSAPGTGRDFLISGDFTHSAGVFTPNSGTAIFDATSVTVSTDQVLSGTTTFYNLTKIVPAGTDEIHSFTFTADDTVTVTNYLTLTGIDNTHRLLIRSTVDGVAGDLLLDINGGQTIAHVDVKDNDAATGVTLVARGSSVQTGVNTPNWLFGAATIKWDGSQSTDWDDQLNWDLGIVPLANDHVIIRTVDEDHGLVIGNQPELTSAVNIGSLTLRETSTSLSLATFDLTVADALAPPGVLSNNGIIYLYGTENVSIAQIDPDSGTFVYQGNNSGGDIGFNAGSRPTTFYNLIINDLNVSPSNFLSSQDMTINGSFTINGGTMTSSANSIDLAGNFDLITGAFSAPGTGKSLYVAGNFTHTAGVFTHSNGTVVFDAAGTDQAISGDTTFYAFEKQISVGSALVHQLILDDNGTQTVAASLVLKGLSTNALVIRSDSLSAVVAERPAELKLQTGSFQNIQHVDVRDSNAADGVALVARGAASLDSGNNTNWIFGIPTVKWDGSVSTDWADPLNWDLGLVPLTGDDVTLRGIDPLSIPANQPIVNQPVLSALSGAVAPRDLILETGATLTLEGYGLTVSNALSNHGTIIAQGGESLAILETDIDSGTFIFTGDNTADVSVNKFDAADTGIDFFNLVLADSGVPSTYFTQDNMHVYGTLQVTSGVLDISTGSDSMTVDGATTISAGAVVNALNGGMDLNSSIDIYGTLSAPAALAALTVAGSWSLDSLNGATFINNNGQVILDTSAPAVIRGDTVFYDLLVNEVGGKSLTFEAGSNQTVSHDLDFIGSELNKIILRSLTDGMPWTITLPSGMKVVTDVDVKDSIANVAGSPNHIFALNSIDQKVNGISTNNGWTFGQLFLITPADGRIVGPNPVIIGRAIPGQPVSVVDQDGATVATGLADTNGNFRVILGQDQASLGTVTVFSLPSAPAGLVNVLQPSFSGNLGPPSNLTVLDAPSSSNVPVITNPVDGGKVIGDRPTITGTALAGAAIYVVANDSLGVQLLTLPPDAYAGQGTVAADGTFAVELTQALPRGVNYLSVVVNGVSSSINTYILNDIHGFVFDSKTNNPIKGANVYIYKGDGTLAVPGTDISTYDANPFITGDTGEYTFFTDTGEFYLQIEAYGYTYPSTIADSELPAGRVIVTGSRAEHFTIGTAVIVLDQPMDANQFLFRVEKTANKTEASVGEVVTYTVTIENLSDQNAVLNTYLNDVIPPGFKYMNGRVQLDGDPIEDSVVARPLIFTSGAFTPHQKKTLRYQLVIGSGVAPGNYENTAFLKYDNGSLISNRAHETVKVVMDPLFDAGTVFGKVFYDLNENGRQDAPEYIYEDREEIIEQQVPNVHIVMEDGTSLITDKNGQFHVPGLIAGRHLLRVDERSLPKGSYLTTDKVQVVDVTPGMVYKVNFGINVDNAQDVGQDVRFFEKNIRVDQRMDQLAPLLNVDMFDKELLLNNDAVIKPVEFRIFMNYAPFISSWKLQVVDKDTRRLVKEFTGSRYNIHDPVLWDGRDSSGRYVRVDRNYAYIVKVEDEKNGRDETKEKVIPFKVLTDFEAEALVKRTDEEKKKESEARDKDYREWLIAQVKVDNSELRSIFVRGETLTIDPQETDVRQVRILKNGEFFIDLPVQERQVLTARALLDDANVKNQPLEIILPDGDYEIEVISADGALGNDSPRGSGGASAVDTAALASSSGVPALDVNASPSAVPVSQYRKPLKVGEDYMMFVAMGDGKVGYNVDRGNIEPVQSVDKYRPGFYQEGKMAYYLKGKVKGKYIITSSFDSDRKQKEMFRSIKDDQYYPVYGDSSQINYDATNTQGNLYVMLEWDKSQAVWGNYAVDLKDTEFAQYSRTLYGGKVDYTNVANNPYGDPRTRVITFYAEVRQRSAHNEFLGTGGSLYYLKHQDIIVGSVKIHLEVRDAVTGQVRSTTEMKDGVDYDIDNSQGRILFWRPVTMSADTGRIISNQLLSGDPVYVVMDYEYEVKDKMAEATQGVRVAQAVGDNVVVGGTYVEETQASADYSLKGQDVTAHLGKATTVKFEYAETTAQDSGSFVSTDGGITFSELAIGNLATGKAYGIRQDTRLFDRLGLKSYYKWIENNFATASTSSQQGKQLSGLGLTFDLTPVTRLTANYDVQKLIEQGNLQTQMQVGAQETATTVWQLVHDARRLRITSEYRHQKVVGKDVRYSSETNQEQDTLALQADYDINEKTAAKVKYQVDPTGKPTKNGQVTTGLTRQLTDKLSATVEESFGTAGTAMKVAATANITPKLAVTTDYALARAADGTVLQTRTTALTGQEKIGDKMNIETTYSVTQTDKGPAQTAAAFGVGANTEMMIDDAALKAGVKVQADDKSILSRGLAFDATKAGKDGSTTTGGVDIDETAAGAKTTLTLGEKGALAPGRDIVAERTFAYGQAGEDRGDTYKIVQEKSGKKLETSYTKKFSDNQTERSASNIFGLTGDVNDRIAASASFERGQVQNIDGSIYTRIAVAGGLGYVEKDEDGQEKIKSSTKLEARLDRGAQDKQQLLVYQDAQGKVTDELTLSAKFQYSQTKNRAIDKVEAQYKEIMLGTAFRPIDNDRLNLFAKYTYKENQGPSGQINISDIQETKMHVVSAEGAYELTDDWQLVEKLAYRIMEEKVAGFEFAKTHTWLLINRANYRLNQDWKVGAEYRILTQREAQDRKSGFLVEGVRSINDNMELGIGYNFTDFVDDLTNLGYTVQGPYVRMTGKLYDRTPEERARARQKWLDHRIEHYAWKMVNDEFAHKDSAVVLELNQMYMMAQEADSRGLLEESRQIYKDILQATQIMFEEAANFVRKHISFEEKLYNAFQRAKEYYDKGEFWQAKKLWEKIVEEAERSMLQ